jgi:hypothetical protein
MEYISTFLWNYKMRITREMLKKEFLKFYRLIAIPMLSCGSNYRILMKDLMRRIKMAGMHFLRVVAEYKMRDCKHSVDIKAEIE